MNFNVFNPQTANNINYSPTSAQQESATRNQNLTPNKVSIFSAKEYTQIASNGRIMGGGRITNNSDDYSAGGVGGSDDGAHFYQISPKESLGGWGTSMDIDGIYLDGNTTYKWNGRVIQGSDRPEDGIKINDTQAIEVNVDANGVVILSGKGEYKENLTQTITGTNSRPY